MRPAKRQYKTLVIALGLSILPTMAQAESPQAEADRDDITALPFEELLKVEVISASRIARQVSDSPSAVSIVTAKDIHDFGYRSLADILNSMRGLYTSYDRIYDYLGGRGYGRPGDYSGRILLLIDGVQANDNLYNQSFLGTDGILDTSLIDRVEYVSGPGSVSYGNNAYFGIINVITKKGGDINGAQVAAGVGSYGSREARLTYGKRLDNGVDILLSGSGLNSTGQNLYFPEFDSPATNNGNANHLDGQHNRRLFGKIQRDEWQLEAGFVNRLKNFPTAAYNADFNAAPSYYEDESKFLSAKHHSNLSDQLKMSLQASYGDYLYHSASVFGSSLYLEGSIGRWWNANATFVGTWFTGQTLVFGADFRNDYQRKASTPAAVSNNDMQTLGLFIQDEIVLRPDLKANVGGRYDLNTENPSHFSPRIALMYNVQPDTSLRLSYSSAFRLPNAFEKYYDDGGTTIPNRELKHESVRSIELVAEKNWGSKAHLLATIYHQRTDNFISSVPYAAIPGATQAINIAGGETTGAEFEYERHWESGIRLRTSYAFQDSQDANGQWSVNSPRHLGKFNLSTPLLSHSIRAG